MKFNLKKIKKMVPTFFALILVFSSFSFAVPLTPPEKPEDVPFFVNLVNFIGFGVLIVSTYIMASGGLRWGILHAKAQHEDDPAKLSEYDTLIKKSVKNAVLGLSGSIVGVILSFFFQAP